MWRLDTILNSGGNYVWWNYQYFAGNPVLQEVDSCPWHTPYWVFRGHQVFRGHHTKFSVSPVAIMYGVPGTPLAFTPSSQHVTLVRP